MRSSRRGPILLAVAVALSCAQPPPDPRALFERAAERIEASTVFEYAFEYRETGAEGSPGASLRGTATIERLSLSGSEYRARLRGWRVDRDGTELPAFDVAHDGEDVYAVDRDTATVRHSPLAAAGPTLLVAADPALMYPFFDPRSLTGEAQAATVIWEGTDDIVGVRCDSLRVTYDDDEEDSRWCIGADLLPRRMEWIADGGSRLLEIVQLTTDESVSETRFTLEVPAGYALREVEYGPPLGSPATDWTLPLLGGGTVSLAGLSGRVVLLDFWATWCPPCLESLAGLAELQTEFANQPVSVFAVNTMETGDPIVFAREQGIAVPVLLEGDELHDRYAPGNLPAFVVIDPSGRHAGFGLGYFGERSERHARRLIERALSSDSRAP